MDAIVAHVPHATQHHTLRKAPGAPDVSRAQLPQHREQGVTHQGVDLIQQKHQRPRVGFGPAPQRFAEGAIGTELGEQIRYTARKSTARRPRDQFAQDRPHGPAGVFAARLPGLQVRVHATVLARRAAVQQIPQREQRGCLARLPGRMEYGVTLVADERQHLLEIEAIKRRHTVVVRRYDGSRRVEEAHGPGRERSRGGTLSE